MNPREKFEQEQALTKKQGQMLAEVEDILRTMPEEKTISADSPVDVGWIGRAAAVIVRWDPPRTYAVDIATKAMSSGSFGRRISGFSTLRQLLHQARADLRADLGTLSTVIQSGQVFDYFDELRKVIEPARVDLFFVDPYLDAEFVSRYLPNVAAGVAVRLLGGPKRMATLLPAVDALVRQQGLAVEVRAADELHDRYLFVDRAACYLSGASFKDGAKKAPAILTQITDAFQAMWDTYEKAWQNGKRER